MALTELAIKAAKPKENQYKLVDGEGLYLLVHPNGSKYWRFNFRFDGKQKTYAIGKYPEIGSAQARTIRFELRQMLSIGLDPSQQKKIKLAQEGITTFESVAREWHASNNNWGVNHKKTVLNSLDTHIFPYLGSKDIKALKTRDLWAPLKKVYDSGSFELAQRLLQRVKSIMRYAVQTGIIEYNPSHDLTGVFNQTPTTHRAALPLDRIHELLNKIENYAGRTMTKLTLQFALLTFVRSSELRFARWSEFDFKNNFWTIPESREPIEGIRYSDRGMKMKTPHIVPLSTQAIEILMKIKKLTSNDNLVFVGDFDHTKVMSDGTINKALRIMGYDTKTEVCGHGFRTMACSSLIESGLWTQDAVERQMSHQERNGVRAAYIHKAEHIKERRLMMQWWGDFLDANRSEIVSPFEFKK